MPEKKNQTFHKRTLLLVIFSLIFAFSAYQLGMTWYGYYQGNAEYQKLKNMVVLDGMNLDTGVFEYPSGMSIPKNTMSEDIAQVTSAGESSALEPIADDVQGVSETEIESSAQTEKETEPGLKFIDFSSLKAINQDAKGWLTMYGTKISYPIVQAADNDYYLRRTFYGTNNKAGSLFIDYLIADGMEGKNVIVYGHNMADGTMFGTLSYYKNESMMKNYPAFLVHTEERTYEYAVFAVYKTYAASDTYTWRFASDESFLDYIGRMKAQSLYDTGVEVAAGDKILTLSTCSGKEDDRFIVQAKRVE